MDKYKQEYANLGSSAIRSRMNKRTYQYVREIDSFYDTYHNPISNFLFQLHVKIRNKIGRPIVQFSPKFRTKRELVKWEDDIGFESPIKDRQVLCYGLTLLIRKGDRCLKIQPL